MYVYKTFILIGEKLIRYKIFKLYEKNHVIKYFGKKKRVLLWANRALLYIFTFIVCFFLVTILTSFLRSSHHQAY